MKKLFSRITTAATLTSILLGSVVPAIANANTSLAFKDITSKDVSDKLQALKNIDLAVDADAGVVFVLKTSEKNSIHVVDISTEKEIATIDAQSNEIELANGNLYSLSKDSEKSKIAVYSKSPTGWSKKSETEIDSSSLSNVGSLHAEIDGSITVSAYDKSKDENVVVIYSDRDSGSLTEKERVSTDDMIQISAPEKNPAEKTKKEFQSGKAAGFTAGLLTGLGFAFRQFFGNGWGLAIGAGGLSTNGAVDANIGVELMRVLDEKEKMRFYALFGASSFYSRKLEWRPADPDPTKPESYYTTGDNVFVSDASYNFGVGLGIEWAPAGFANNGISFSFELPLAVSLKHEEAKGVSFMGIRPIPSVSIVYYFKH